MNQLQRLSEATKPAGKTGQLLAVARGKQCVNHPSTDAEHEVKARKVGLWRDLNPIAPWDWRKSQR